MTPATRLQTLALMDSTAADLSDFLESHGIKPTMLDDSGLLAMRAAIKRERPELFTELVAICKDPADGEYLWRSAIARPMLAAAFRRSL